MPPDRKKSMSEEEKLYETYALKLYEALVSGKVQWPVNNSAVHF